MGRAECPDLGGSPELEGDRGGAEAVAGVDARSGGAAGQAGLGARHLGQGVQEEAERVPGKPNGCYQ